MKPQKNKTDLGSKTWVVVLGLIATIISIVVFVTGKNLPDFFAPATAEPAAGLNATTVLPAVAPTQPPAPTTMPALTLVPTLSPTQTTISVVPSETPVSNRWSGVLSVRLPTLNEIREEKPVSLWDANLINVGDRYAPGVSAYAGKAQVGSEYLLPIYWCAATADRLAQNLENIETVFTVNAEFIPEKAIFTYNYDTKTGWNCNYHAVVLGDWVKGVPYTIEIKRTLKQALSDGKSDYAPGEYLYRLSITGQ